MLIKTDIKKGSGRFRAYGVMWQATIDHLAMHLDCIRAGGHWLNKTTGEQAGGGMIHHFKEATRFAFPEIDQHRWFDFMLEHWLANKYVGVMGPKSSGKSTLAAVFHLIEYYAWPDCTTVLMCSTTKERLEDRIWGEIKKLHKGAKRLHEWLPGTLIEGRQRIVTDTRLNNTEGRDFRNGFIGVPCKKGNQYVGMGDFIGIKNKRMRLCGDELQLLPRAFIDSLANLSGNQDLKVTGMGNPAQTLDSLGFLCEPNSSIGGWDGGVDQQPGTKTWPTRFPEGICVQLPGGDSPNNDFPDDEPPRYPYLIHRKMMQDDAKIWGTSDWHYLMFNEACMPRGQGNRRVLTLQMCRKFGAFTEAQWRDTNLTKIAFLDAAYRGVGGDRCVFGELNFGKEAEAPKTPEDMISNFISQSDGANKNRQIISLVDLMVVPISADKDADLAEDQIVRFVMAQCEARGIRPENFFFDSGMRTSLVQAFSRLWSPWVGSVDCGGKPTETAVSSDIKTMCREYYSKFITELWFSVRMAVESSQFRGLTEEAAKEFSEREWKLVSGNRIEVESKEDMKLKTGHSPDLADAVAVGLFGARQRGFQIARLIAPDSEQDYNGKNWRRELRERANKLHRAGELVNA